ncbi:EEF1A lysine methyltransferase 1 like protein [Verticillium longisporum]|uniref:EEF1A lysine methyltransferase 1 like protein n=1 Tax=Verticillium longisporum TaxID=100787 RepID=A0A8I2ZTD9_VERLO|nr:EEF1A lysine methyltransferase 1 like protein [Verticillium longisporum]
MDDSDDEPLALSSHALAALAEFNAEKDAHQKRFEELNAKAEENAARNVPLSMSVFEEDWNKSQFWYSDETALAYAGELLRDVDETDTVAVISAPSVFIALRNLLGQYGPEQPKPKIILLEHDDRFRMFPEFIWYDFAHPFKLPGMNNSIFHKKLLALGLLVWLDANDTRALTLGSRSQRSGYPHRLRSAILERRLPNQSCYDGTMAG